MLFIEVLATEERISKKTAKIHQRRKLIDKSAYNGKGKGGKVIEEIESTKGQNMHADDRILDPLRRI